MYLLCLLFIIISIINLYYCVVFSPFNLVYFNDFYLNKADAQLILVSIVSHSPIAVLGPPPPSPPDGQVPLTSLAYPLSTTTAHVSAVPNHQTGRYAGLRGRALLAMAGGIGWELDLRMVRAPRCRRQSTPQRSKQRLATEVGPPWF